MKSPTIRRVGFVLGLATLAACGPATPGADAARDVATTTDGGALDAPAIDAPGLDAPGVDVPGGRDAVATCATPQTTTLDDTATGTGDDQFDFAGTWQTATGAAKFGGSDHFTDVAGATYVLRFVGVGVTLYGAHDAHHGIAAVSIDGGPETQVDFYGPARTDQVVVFTSPALAAGEHAVHVRVTGTHSAASTGSVVTVDRADVLGCAGDAGSTRDATVGTDVPMGDGGGSSILTRRGRVLYLHGVPYRNGGVNAFGLSGCDARAYTDAEIDGFFASLPADRLTRTWAFQPQGLAGLDRVVHAAEAHHQLLILSLADGDCYCGDTDGSAGAPGTGKTDAWYEGGYRTNYLPWVRMVVARYRTSSAVGMWEIINEPHGANNTAMRAFFDDAAATIKGIDPSHLVETGCLGEYSQGTTDYALVHGGPNVDVGSVHEYDYDYMSSHTIVSPHFTLTLAAMNSIDKPLIVGETGIQATHDGSCSTTLATRATAVRAKYDAYLSMGAASVNVWSWQVDCPGGCQLNFCASDPIMDVVRSYVPPAGP